MPVNIQIDNQMFDQCAYVAGETAREAELTLDWLEM